MSPPVGGIRAHRQAAHEPRGSTHQRQLRLARAAGSGSEGARKGKSMARSARRPGRQAQVAGLLLALRLVGAWEASGGCASVGTPPGGPPDSAPPRILHVRPESGAVVPNYGGDVVIQFDETVDEMPGAGTAGGLERQVLLSPVAGAVKVSWHRSSVTVKPKEGWKRRAYRLEILPGFLDLRHNRSDSGKTVLFTTGPEIGHARIGGIVLKWIEQTILARALIEAVPLPDTIGYLTLADSGGQFNLQNLAPGRYIVYATSDDNGDRRRSPREAYDSTLVTLDSSSNVALLAFPHDTIAPRPRGATYVDSITVRGDFSQALDPTAPLDTAHVHVLQLPDSPPVAVAQLLTQQQYDSLTNAVRQKAESAGAAAIKHDTAAAPNIHPTVPPGPPAQAAPPPAPPPPPPPPPPPSPVQPAGRGRGAAARPSRQPVDTALVRKLLAQRPVPSDKIVIRLVHPLKPETRYVVRIESAMNLIGKKGGGDIGFTVPKPVPVDTTRRAPRAMPKPPPPPPP